MKGFKIVPGELKTKASLKVREAEVLKLPQGWTPRNGNFLPDICIFRGSDRWGTGMRGAVSRAPCPAHTVISVGPLTEDIFLGAFLFL